MFEVREVYGGVLLVFRKADEGIDGERLGESQY
jgi:hypothetical protein